MIKDIKEEDIGAIVEELSDINNLDADGLNNLQTLSKTKKFLSWFVATLAIVLKRKLVGGNDWAEMLAMYGFELGYKVCQRQYELEKLEKIK